MSYQFCPYCKEEILFNNYTYTCKNNHKIYINPAPCVSIIPIKDNKLLFSKRGIEPRKGTIDILGGFVNVGETIQEAAIREIFEESGLKIKVEKLIGEYHEEYTPKITYPLCFAYTASIIGGELKAQDDVSELFWVDKNDIKNLDLTGSFPTIKTMLEDLLRNI